MTLAAAIGYAYNPDIRTAAAIGFGSGMTTHTLLGNPAIERVDTIEIEPAMVEGARQFGRRVERAYSDPRSRIIIDDAKSFFARSRSKYDLIVSEPSNPWVAGVASLFTEEFYRRLRDYLSDDGLLVQWIQVYEFDTRLLASITTALSRSFPEYAVYFPNGGDVLIVARKEGALGLPSNRIFQMQPLAQELQHLGIVSLADLEVRRVASGGLVNRMARRMAIQANSDYFPIVELDAPESRFRQSTANDLLTLSMASIPVVEMLERRTAYTGDPVSGTHKGISPQVDGAVEAQEAVDLLIDAARGTNNPIPPGHAYAPSIAVTRMMLFDCVNPGNASVTWDEVLVIASAVNPYLSPTRVDPLWKALEASRCLRNLPPEYTGWLKLFRAVGARDGPACVREAEALLQTKNRTTVELEYLVLAVAAGYLASDNPSAARRVLDAAADEIPAKHRQSPWFVLLRNLAAH